MNRKTRNFASMILAMMCIIISACSKDTAPSAVTRPSMVKVGTTVPRGADAGEVPTTLPPMRLLAAQNLTVAASGLPQLRGTNLTGGEMEYGSSNTANPVSNTDYLFVSHQDIDYLLSKGVNFGRLLFSWEALQPNGVNTAFPSSGNSGTYVSNFFDAVNYATSKGMYIMIEPHGAESSKFARYKGNVIGSSAVPNSAFADLWTRLATQFKSNPKVIFGLMNEPNNMSTTGWFKAAADAMTAIRATGATQLILVPGNGWTGAASWTSNWYDTDSTKVSNAQAYLTYIKGKDPLDNTAASIHLYFDTDAGGASNTVVSDTIGTERIKVVGDWAKANGVKFHLGEFAAPNSAQGKTVVNSVLAYMNTNSSTVIGWAWWAYGPPTWWGGYQFTLCPKTNYTVDSPFMSWLSSNFVVQPTPTSTVTATATATGTSTPTSPTAPTKPVAYTKGAVFTTNSGTTNWVVVPSTYDSSHATPMQVLVWLHGCGGYGQYDISDVSPGGNQNWISIAVGGREGSCWSSLANDGSKILAAIADLKTHFNVDPKKVFLGGYSSGGDIGYELLFSNPTVFAGALFENTGPSSVAMTLSASSTPKMPIVHLSHVSDTTYPIASIRTKMATLKTNGYSVTLIEKPGTHWDDDTATSGTNYDYRAYVLPYLVNGFSNPPTTVATIRVGTSTAAMPGDQGFSSVRTIAAGGSVPAGTYTMKVETRTTYSDNSTFCVNLAVYNTSTKIDVDWSEMTVDLRGHTLSSSWNSTVTGTSGVIKIAPVASTKTVVAGQKNSVGFCVKRNSDASKNYYQVLVKSLTW